MGLRDYFLENFKAGIVPYFVTPGFAVPDLFSSPKLRIQEKEIWEKNKFTVVSLRQYNIYYLLIYSHPYPCAYEMDSEAWHKTGSTWTLFLLSLHLPDYLDPVHFKAFSFLFNISNLSMTRGITAWTLTAK